MGMRIATLKTIIASSILIVHTTGVYHVGQPGWKLPTTGEKTGITDHHSYVGPLTAGDAELKLGHGNCYLLRYSECAKIYKLSVAAEDKNGPFFQHFRINIINDHAQTEYEIEGTKKKFDDFSELLKHYENSPVNKEIFAIGQPFQDEKSLLQKDHEKEQTKHYCCTIL
jgi:hypothetical protein